MPALFFLSNRRFVTARRWPLLCCLLLLALVLAPRLWAQPRELVAGEHYQIIDEPVATSVGPGFIEVSDMFWYGCPECAKFAPMMTYWGDGIAGDLSLRRRPAIWNDIMATHARLYFAAEELEIAPRVHAEAFRQIHELGNPLANEQQIQQLFADMGIELERFQQAWNAETVVAAVASAREITAQAGVDRVPALLVNGQYRVTRNQAVPALEEMVITTNLLIREIRSTRRDD